MGDWFLPDEDRGTYAEGLRRGGYLISVEATDEQYERVIDILDDEGTIDIDERAELLAGWRAGPASRRDDVLSGATANLTTGDAGTTSGPEATCTGRRTRFSDDLAATDTGSATRSTDLAAPGCHFDADDPPTDRAVDLTSPAGPAWPAPSRLSDGATR